MLEALCRSSGTTLDIRMSRDGPPITQRTSGLGLSLDEPNAFDLIAWINEWHQTVKIRYEFTIERELPACSGLVSLADAIIAATA